MSRAAALLAVCACAGALVAAHTARMTGASFTANASVGGNSVTADRLANYLRVAPGPLARGDVDTLSIDLGVVRGTLSVGGVFSVTNVTTQPTTATLSLSGPAQVAGATFDASHAASVTLAPGQTTQVSLALSPQVAGRGSGTLRLGLAGLSWLYRTYPLQVAAAPQAPGSLGATARAGGLVSLSWPASATTTNLAGYDVYRSSGGGAFAKIGSTAAAQTSYDDRATADGTAYSYRVRAVATGDATLDSPDSPAAAATADATPPPVPAAVSLTSGWINAANRSSVSLSVTLRQPAAAGDAVTATLGSVAQTVPAPAGATSVLVGGFDASSLPDGPVALSASSSDAAGNASGAVTGSASKDTTPPGAPTASYVDMKKNGSDYVVGNAEAGATVSATQTEPVASGPYSATADSSGAYSIAVAASVRDTVTYSVTATDAAGNTSSATSVTYVRTK